VRRHTLQGVRDSFMSNYGSGGMGPEIIANRLHVGPLHDGNISVNLQNCSATLHSMQHCP
jgi:hypothetical protein